MACPANFLLADVKGRSPQGLGGSAALCLMGTQDLEVDMAILDESNAFSAVSTPKWMHAYFGCPEIQAKDILWKLSEAQRNHFAPDETLVPLAACRWASHTVSTS